MSAETAVRVTMTNADFKVLKTAAARLGLPVTQYLKMTGLREARAGVQPMADVLAQLGAAMKEEAVKAS
jgi:hypothetical protein